MLKLVSLDLWNTIIEDDPKLEEKRGEIRVKKIFDYLLFLNISFEEVKKAYESMSVWLFETQNKTLRSINTTKQIFYIFKQFNAYPNPIVLNDIKKTYESAIFQIPPSLVDGVEELLIKLKKLNLKIAILSDAGRTPGWALRETLNRLNISKYFDKMFFSDEIGYVKPNKNSFKCLIKEFNVKKEEVVHIGDSLEKDIIGAKNFGINYIHFSKEGNSNILPNGKNFDEIYKILINNFCIETSLF